MAKGDDVEALLTTIGAPSLDLLASAACTLADDGNFNKHKSFYIVTHYYDCYVLNSVEIVGYALGAANCIVESCNYQYFNIENSNE